MARWQRLGLLGALLVLVAFGTFNALATPPFAAGDETAHANYGLQVAAGDLPEFDERYPHRIPGMSSQHPTMVAVHPPLYYLLVGPVLRAGVATGHPAGGLVAARLVTLLLGCVALLLVARLAAALVPGRPAVAVASAALLAGVTSYQQVSAFVYNDALAVLTTTGALVQVALALRYGADRRRTGLLALWAVLAAVTRASGLEVAALAALAAAAPPAGQRDEPWRRRLRPALLRVAVVGGAVAVTTGWFYLRNQALYGDLTGSGRATAGAQPGPGVLANATSPAFWLDQWSQLWGYITAVNPVVGPAAVGAYALLAAAAVGLVKLAVRGRRRPPADRRLALAWLAMGGHAALITAIVLSYFARGALPFGRYFYPLLPLLPILVALGLAALGVRRLRSGVPLLAGIVVAAGVSVLMTGVVLAGIATRAGGAPSAGVAGLPEVLTDALAAGGVARPGLVLAGLAGVLVTGLVLVAVGLTRLPDRPAPSHPDPNRSDTAGPGL